MRFLVHNRMAISRMSVTIFRSEAPFRNGRHQLWKGPVCLTLKAGKAHILEGMQLLGTSLHQRLNTILMHTRGWRYGCGFGERVKHSVASNLLETIWFGIITATHFFRDVLLSADVPYLIS